METRNKMILYALYISLGILSESSAMEPIRSKDQYWDFYESVRKDDVDAVKKFFSYGKIEGDNVVDPLVYAARVGSSKSLEFLLENFYIEDSKFSIRSQAFLEASFNGNVENMEMLRVAGVDINYSENGAITPLWASIESDRIEVFRYLLSIGADYKFLNNKGENLLFPAVVSGNLHVIEALVGLGLDTNITLTDKVYGDVVLEDYVKYKWGSKPAHQAAIIKLIKIDKNDL